MSQVIVITSGKGGVGKSNICINSALSLSGMGYRTCLFDADLGLANAGVLLGIDQELTLDDVISRDRTVQEIILHTRWGFDIIPGSSGVEKIANLSGDRLNGLIHSFAALTDYDYVLVDTASGISQNVISFCLASHETIIVLTPETTSLTDAYALLKVLDSNTYNGNVRILINNCTTAQLAKKTYSRYKKVVDNYLSLDIHPAGIILRDPYFEKAVSSQQPLLELYPESVGATCIHAFVANMVGKWGGTTSESTLAEFWQRYIELHSQETENQTQKPEPPHDAIHEEEDSGQESAEPLNMDKLLYTEATPPAVLVDTGDEPEIEKQVSGDNISPLPMVQTSMALCSPEHILHSAFQLVVDGNITRENATRLILSDPLLTLETLRLAAFTMSSSTHSSVNVQRFLETITASKIRSMLLKIVVDYSYTSASNRDEKDHLQFWSQSRWCAELAREIALQLNYPFPGDAYLCGLLLNIGKLSSSAPSAENAGNDHATRGAELLKMLPVNTMICDGVRFHHYPEEQIRTAFDLVRIVYVANCLAKEQAAESRHAELLGDISLDALQIIQEKTRSQILQPIADYDSDADNFRQQVANYLFMQSVLPQVSSTNQFSDPLQPIFNTMQILFGYRNIICFLPDNENDALEIEGATGDLLDEQIKGVRISFGVIDSTLVRALTTGKMQLFNPVSNSGKSCLMDQQLNRILGGEVMISLPLKKGDQTIGVLVCGMEGQGVDNFDTKREQLQQFAAQIAPRLSLTSHKKSSTRDTDLEN